MFTFLHKTKRFSPFTNQEGRIGNRKQRENRIDAGRLLLIGFRQFHIKLSFGILLWNRSNIFRKRQESFYTDGNHKKKKKLNWSGQIVLIHLTISRVQAFVFI